jgi:hypothetical protein
MFEVSLFFFFCLPFSLKSLPIGQENKVSVKLFGDANKQGCSIQQQQQQQQ